MIKKKEINKKNRNEKKSKKLSKKEIQNRQVMWAIILMVSLILIILLVPFIVKNFINKFVYLNLDWQKTKLGKIFFYSTRVPIIDKEGNIVDVYTMNFRNDPRDLEKIEFIPLEKDPDIYFRQDKTVYISLNPDMEACEDNTIALIPLAGFLRDFGGFNISSAVSDSDYARANNMTYAVCGIYPQNTVIYINSGNKTEIKKTEKDCYELTYSNCEIIKATEKFELLILEKYMSYFTREESFFDVFR